MTTTPDAIKRYLALGWSVVPLVARTKEPPAGFGWGDYVLCRPEVYEWRNWWQRWPGCNIAVVLGGCETPLGTQLVCVDTDTAEAEAWVAAQVDLPATPTATTAKGRHRYYLAPAGLPHYRGSEGRPEVRAGEHYMVLPPSTHPSGVQYAWEDGLAPFNLQPAELPAWGCNLMRGDQPPAEGNARPTAARVRATYGQSALAREVGELTTALAGGRNDALNAAAFSLGQLVAGGELQEAEVVEALLRACQGNGLLRDDGERACRRTIDSGLSRGKLSPRSGSAPQRPAAPARDAQPLPETLPAGIPDLPVDPGDAAETQAAQAVNGIRVAQTAPQAPRRLEEIADRLIAAQDAYAARPRVIAGLRTGFPTLDRHFLGFANHRVIIVHGPSGYGKTTFAKHCIFATGLASLIDGSADALGVYLLEGNARDLLSSYLGYRGEVPWRLRSPGGSEHMTEEWAEVIRACTEEFRALPLHVEDREEFRDLGRLESSIRALAEQQRLSGIVIDHAQEIIAAGVQEGHQTLNCVAERCRNIAEDLGLPVLLLSQTKLVDGEFRPEYSARLQQKATLSFVVTRGGVGQKREQAVLSNVTRVICDKARCDEGPSLPLTLYGNRDTGRLHETPQADQLEGQPQEQEREEVFEWPNN